MKFAAYFWIIWIFIALTACATLPERIASERKWFLEDASIYTDMYPGSGRGFSKFQFLSKHDPQFGDFLVSLVPRTEDAHVIIAAVIFFSQGSTVDRSQFEGVVSAANPALLRTPVNLGSDHNLVFGTLSEWIDQVRKNTNWANQALQPTAATGRG